MGNLPVQIFSLDPRGRTLATASVVKLESASREKLLLSGEELETSLCEYL